VIVESLCADADRIQEALDHGADGFSSNRFLLYRSLNSWKKGHLPDGPHEEMLRNPAT